MSSAVCLSVCGMQLVPELRPAGRGCSVEIDDPFPSRDIRYRGNDVSFCWLQTVMLWGYIYLAGSAGLSVCKISGKF